MPSSQPKPNVLHFIKGTKIFRRLPSNVVPEDERFFTKELTAEVEDIKILQLSNVNLVSQGAIFKWMKPIPGLSLFNDIGEIVPYSIPDLLKIRFFWPGHPLNQGYEYLSIDNIYSHTYYHWLTEALPRLFLVREWLSTAVLLLPNNHEQQFHKDTLKLFNVERIEWLKKKVRYDIPKLITSTQIGRIANYHPMVIKGMVNFIKERIEFTIDYGERIYVSRSRAAKRGLANEKEVEIYLTNQGFRTIHFEDYNFVQQVSIMHHCKILVGVHGAGLANMIFMQAAGKIMELRLSDENENYFYFSLASLADLDYYYQFCSAIDEKASVQDADIVVDLGKFKENIQLILS